MVKAALCCGFAFLLNSGPEILFFPKKTAFSSSPLFVSNFQTFNEDFSNRTETLKPTDSLQLFKEIILDFIHLISKFVYVENQESFHSRYIHNVLSYYSPLNPFKYFVKIKASDFSVFGFNLDQNKALHEVEEWFCKSLLFFTDKKLKRECVYIQLKPISIKSLFPTITQNGSQREIKCCCSSN